MCQPQELPVCLHCEKQPPVSKRGLCASCKSVYGIRRLYRRRKGWTPAWEAHLIHLTRRAQLGLPLFEADGREAPDNR